MELTWDLERLYPSFSSEQYQRDEQKLKELAEALHSCVLPDTFFEPDQGAYAVTFLTRYNAWKAVYLCLFSYAELCYSADSANEEAINWMDHLDEVKSKAEEAHTVFTKWLARLEPSTLDRMLDADAYLLEHSFYLREQQRLALHRLSEEEEAIIAGMQATGAKAWERLYMRTLSTLCVNLEIDGKVREATLAELRDGVYDSDAAVRQAAYAAEGEACRRVAEQSAACINAVSGEAAAIYQWRGYASPLHKVLEVSRMDEETLTAMLVAIEESLPLFQRYYRKKAQLLGHTQDQLPFYDMYAPIGEEPATAIAYSTARDLIASSYSEFSPDMGAFARKAFDERWIDAEPRSGKSNFGLCVDIFPLNESRIMASFTGKPVDVSVLAHEIGHAYHSSHLAGLSMVNTDYPIPIAETASIFGETLVNERLLQTATAEEAASILERSLSDAGYYIVDFYARYLFESRLYTRRAQGSLSVEELNQLMADAMAEAYGDSIEPGSIHPYMWISKAGYYMAGNEFLNFPYSFGLLFSKGLYAQYKKQGEGFVERYRDFLAGSSRNTIATAAQQMGMDVHSPQFWREALGLIAADIEVFCTYTRS
jgi:pepF/M3 family oligoendopeptidase